MKKKWIKYKYKYRVGIDREWKYYEIDSCSEGFEDEKDEGLEYYLDDICCNGYKSIDYELISEDTIPVEVFEKKVKELNNTIKNAYNEISKYEEIVKVRKRSEY